MMLNIISPLSDKILIEIDYFPPCNCCADFVNTLSVGHDHDAFNSLQIWIRG